MQVTSDRRIQPTIEACDLLAVKSSMSRRQPLACKVPHPMYTIACNKTPPVFMPQTNLGLAVIWGAVYRWCVPGCINYHGSCYSIDD
jgi:hypothetical protein